jgi:S-(hydroxymethyl)glutathione dehydrogenase / alcohol dehydrogenase
MSALPTITRAAILRKTGAELAIEQVELPPLACGQVLVKVHYSGVCRSQLMEVRGGRGEDKWLPHLLGHEGTGEVLEIGEGVTRFAAGDRVILGWLKADGLDAPGAKYRCEGEIINAGGVTTFGEHSIVAENRLMLLPEGIGMDVGVLFGCALPTGAGMVFNELNPEPGSRVAVIGLGGVGLSALMALSHYQCEQLIAIDPSAEKRELARSFGATHVFAPDDEALLAHVRGLPQGGVDACVEAGGSVRSIELGFSLIRKGGGRLLFASHPTDGEPIKLLPHELISGKRIEGSWGGGSRPQQDLPKLATLYVKGQFPLEKLLTRCYSLNEINQALADLEAGDVFRPLIRMDHADQ